MLLAAGAATCALPATPAAAITNGQPDEGRHPYVGAVVTHDGKHRKKRLICSGTLVSPTVFVTAAHCLLDEPSRLYVSFDEFVGAPYLADSVRVHPGTAFAHAGYVDAAAPGDTHDIGVIRLDAPVQGIAPAELPAQPLEELQRSGRLSRGGIELVGYGREGIDARGRGYGGGGRRYGLGAFGSLEPYKLNSVQTGTLTGSCNGDSGGPVLLPGTRTVVSVISDGDVACAVHGVNYRLDTASARAFLAEHLAAPARSARVAGKARTAARRAMAKPRRASFQRRGAIARGGLRRLP